jgi:inhibitor of cysteine peptidase
MSKPLLIIILLVVVVGVGYVLFGSSLLKDNATILLEGVAEEIEVTYPELTEEEFDWYVEKDGAVQPIKVMGKGFEATEVSVELYEKAATFFKDEGFSVDLYNIAAGTVGELTGYKKEQTVCLVIGGFTGYKEATGQWIPPDVTKKDVDVKCGVAEEDLEEEISKEDSIKYAMAARYGRKLSQVSIVLDQETDDHVRGGVTFAPGGPENSGFFLAAKQDGQWLIVYDGNGVISCEEIAKFNFPAEMIDDCEDTQNILIEAGEEFSIVLGSNPTTGFEWMVEFDEEFVELSSRSFTPSSELVGAGGVDIFAFDSLEAGETEIRFIYVRPWESRQPVDEKIYTVTIEE